MDHWKKINLKALRNECLFFVVVSRLQRHKPKFLHDLGWRLDKSNSILVRWDESHCFQGESSIIETNPFHNNASHYLRDMSAGHHKKSKSLMDESIRPDD